jgi:hypothetical protein
MSIAVKRLIVILMCAIGWPRGSAAEKVDYVTQVKPIFAARCYACHGALRQRAGLRLDTAAFLNAGGDSGSSIEPGNSQDSLLIMMLTGESSVRMPPEEDGPPLTADQIALIRKWIDQGAPAPDEPVPADPRTHWAYQPPERRAVPVVQDAAWSENPVDAFLAAEHESRGLIPLEIAGKAVLLRRMYFDLVGLPPTREQLAAFLRDESPRAYERVVDQLLDSPQYGERWARHWMDVWRYSDWAGFEQEIRNSARHIWRWRDWIIESLNADKGYDQMVLEMLAGDELAPTDPNTLRATGFLARNWYKFNRNTWLDNTVEHTAKAFLGVTMNCCRCHDHKYDPISQVEYYELRAIFEPHDVRTDRVPGEPDLVKDGLPRVCDLRPDELTYSFERGNELRPDKSRPLLPAVPDVLGPELAIRPVELPVFARYPALREFAISEDTAAATRRVGECEAARTQAQQAVATAQQKLTEVSPNQSAADSQVAREARAAVDSAVAAAELADRKLGTARATHASLIARIAAERAKYGLSPGADADQLALTAAHAGRELALCQAQEHRTAAEQELARTNAAATSGDDKSRTAVKAAEIKLQEAVAALATAHATLAQPSSDYQPLGDVLPPTSTGRRLAFARWIVDRQNPLAARVAINHIWLRHFGSPLVDNMFDFGLRTPQARNQPLLDWLAVELMDNGWSMKHIHRLLVTSRAYRMKSGGSESDSKIAANVAIDPDNRHLWRGNARRLEAEIIRDALLFVAGSLDMTRGGPDIDCLAAANTPRRSIYFRHAYEKQMKFLELFDGPSTNECYRRSESVVPLQALALANSEVSIDQSRLLARRLSEHVANDAAFDSTFATQAFQQILSRDPTQAELRECTNFLATQAELLRVPERLTAITSGAKASVPPSTDRRQRARENLIHVLLNHNDFVTVR